MDWISVKEKAPEVPCLGLDDFFQVFLMREMVTLFNKFDVPEYYDGGYFDFSTMGFKEIDVGGEKAIIYKKVKYWMPLSEPPKEET